MCRNGVCKCGIPTSSKFHKNGCPPKHRRPWILAQIEKEEREAAAAESRWMQRQEAASTD
jgi:hypothetical protein